MKSKTKIFLFFGSLVLFILMSIGVSAVYEVMKGMTAQELLDDQDVLDERQKQEVLADLEHAGYDLEREYSYYEVMSIIDKMAASDEAFQADWGMIQLYTQGSGMGDMGMLAAKKGKCTSRNFFGSKTYHKCAETCNTQGDCYKCCRAAWSGPGELGDLRYCLQNCDKMSCKCEEGDLDCIQRCDSGFSTSDGSEGTELGGIIAGMVGGDAISP